MAERVRLVRRFTVSRLAAGIGPAPVHRDLGRLAVNRQTVNR
jgi:hypothetical protein